VQSKVKDFPSRSRLVFNSVLVKSATIEAFSYFSCLSNDDVECEKPWKLIFRQENFKGEILSERVALSEVEDVFGLQMGNQEENVIIAIADGFILCNQMVSPNMKCDWK